jgi:hypothetical protein
MSIAISSEALANARRRAPAASRLLVASWVLASLLRGQYLIDQYATRPEQPCGGQASILDIDGSGLPDLVMVNGGGNHICVHHDPIVNQFLGGTPVFLPQYLGGGFHGVVARVDPGPTWDMYILSWQVGYLYSILGAPGGTFVGVPSPTPIATGVSGIAAVGDVNGDGLDDVLSRELGPLGPYQFVLRLNNHPSWTVTWVLSQPTWGIYGKLQDFNGDGYGDFAYLDTSLQNGLMLGATGGVPGPPMTLPGPAGQGAASADVDGDGFLDLVAIENLAGPVAALRLRVRWGDPVQPLVQQTGILYTFATRLSLQSFADLGDFDADGTTDILVVEALTSSCCTAYGYACRIIRGLGSRTFSNVPMTVFEFPPGPFPGPTGGVPPLPFVADWDGDGDTDFFGRFGDGHHWFENAAIFGAGCAGSTGVPAITINDPSLGNAGFAISLTGATAGNPAVLGMSTASTPSTGCGLEIGILPGQLLLPSGPIGFTVVGLGGNASVNLPIPPVPALHGATVFAQWAVTDPAGAFTAGGANYALSPGRMIILW